MHRFLLIFCLFSTLLFSEEERIPYLTSECDALALVDGVVNAYNGKLVQVDQDIEIRGSDPLEMTRFYDGGHHFDSEFGYGVGCNYPALLRAFGIKGKFYAAVELRQGLEVLCELKKDKKNLVGTIAKNYYKSGYTNSCKALLLGEPALAAMQVELSETAATVSLGDGTKRHYRRFQGFEYDTYYRLTYEERPNGNCRYFTYTYNTFPFSLKRIWTTNRDGSVTLNWLEFSQRIGEFLVKASNGQEARYKMKMEKGKVKKGNLLEGIRGEYYKAVIKDATTNVCPVTSYEVIKHSQSFNTILSLSKVKLPNSRFLEVEYDKSERVACLKSSGYQKPVYTFSYLPGKTVVTDARGGKKTYEFNMRRLFRLEEPHRSQVYTWDDKGQLTRHMTFSSKRILTCTRDYSYDELGNVAEIRVKGRIKNTGYEDIDITRFTYGERNTLLTKNQNDIVEFRYEYVPNTNLIAAKRTISDQSILERVFFKYDINGILVRKIVDDGSSQDENDLTNVSSRLITEIEPQLNPDSPGMTLPYRISEWYEENGQKYLIKRVEKFYTKGDLLAEEKVFDATDTYRYSLTFEYNDSGELIRQTNEMGEVTIYSYDLNGNKTYQEKIGSGKKTYYFYDLADRLIEEKEEHDDLTLSKKYIPNQTQKSVMGAPIGRNLSLTRLAKL